MRGQLWIVKQQTAMLTALAILFSSQMFTRIEERDDVTNIA